MGKSKCRAEYIELSNGSYLASFNTDDRRLLERAFLFLERNFEGQVTTLASGTGYLALVIGSHPVDGCTIHAYSDGSTNVRFRHTPFFRIQADFTHSVFGIKVQPDGVLEILMEIQGMEDRMSYYLHFPKEEFGKMLQEFYEEFGEGGNE